MYVLTRAINQYEQDGHYLVTVFETQPTLEEIAQALYGIRLEDCTEHQVILVVHIYNGGGRREFEHEWYYLKRLEHGWSYTLD